MTGRLTETFLRAQLKKARSSTQVEFVDGTVPGLVARLGKSQVATWSLQLRVSGEGGVSARGHALKGKKYRITLGTYPEMSIEAARSEANRCRHLARAGQSPVVALEGAATAGSRTVRQLSETFMDQYVRFKELDSSDKYQAAFDTHINPVVGDVPAELLTREQVRQVMERAKIKRSRPKGQQGGKLGGVEAARTVMGVLRHMYSWCIDESKLKRRDNPVSKFTKNLPKKKEGDVVLSTREARIVWNAAEDCGYPFGAHVQLQQLTGCRLSELASAEVGWLDRQEALLVIPADGYKSDHVHVVPLVPQAMAILNHIPQPTDGPYLFSSDGGRTPVQGFSKFYRVLGHSDGTVTRIYNRYGYVREMRRVLELWANELTGGPSVSA